MIALIVWSVDNNLLLFDGQMTTFYKLAIDHRAKDTMSLQETFFQPIFLLSGGPEFSTFLQFKFSSDIEMCLNAILSVIARFSLTVFAQSLTHWSMQGWVMFNDLTLGWQNLNPLASGLNLNYMTLAPQGSEG